MPEYAVNILPNGTQDLPAIEHGIFPSQSVDNRSSGDVEHAHGIVRRLLPVNSRLDEAIHLGSWLFVALRNKAINLFGGAGPTVSWIIRRYFVQEFYQRANLPRLNP